MYLLGFEDDFKRAVAKVETLDFSMPRVKARFFRFMSLRSFLL
jgi:hypothetical protein